MIFFNGNVEPSENGNSPAGGERNLAKPAEARVRDFSCSYLKREA